MELTPGQIFAEDYRVVRELGRGGMGAVYEVEQLSTTKRRALKLMSEGLLTDADAAERFLREAKVGARVASEHVVEVIAAGVETSRHRPVPWLVMELLEGESLTESVARRGSITPAETKEILRQLCHGLGAAHRAGLVHRDVKPDNVFLAEARSAGADMKVKLLDFGIAKVLSPTVGARGSTTAPMGTPLFMAPEQTRAGQIGPRADVWALGLLAYYMLTGRHYWKAASEPAVPLTALLVEISVDEIEPPSVRAASQGAEVPAGFDPWFLRCVERDVAQRYPNADAAYKALEGRLSGDALATTLASGDVSQAVSAVSETAPASAPAPAPAPAPASAPASRATTFVLGAGVLMLVAGAIAVGWSLRTSETTPAETPPPETTPAEAASPESTGAGMEPLGPREESPVDAGPTEAPAERQTPDGGPGAEPDEEPPPQRYRLTSEEERLKRIFIDTARAHCNTWVANQPRHRARVRVRVVLEDNDRHGRLVIRPRGASACMMNGAGSIAWPRGRARTIPFSFVLEAQTF